MVRACASKHPALLFTGLRWQLDFDQYFGRIPGLGLPADRLHAVLLPCECSGRDAILGTAIGKCRCHSRAAASGRNICNLHSHHLKYLSGGSFMQPDGLFGSVLQASLT